MAELVALRRQGASLDELRAIVREGLLPTLAGGAPLGPVAPSSSSYYGDYPGYREPRGPLVAGPRTGFIESPTPSGGDDTAALQSWLNSATSNTGVLLPGTYQVSAALKLPVGTNLTGTNRRFCNIEATGNNYILEPQGGDNTVENIGFRAAGKQAGTGGVVDFSKGFIVNWWMNRCEVGSNFFQAFKIVSPGEIGMINFFDIFIHEPGGGAGNHSQAVFKSGGKANAERVAVLNLSRIQGLSTTGASEIPAWLECVNTDSLHLMNFGFQFGKRGIVLGVGDTSEKKVTGFKASQGWCDTCSEFGILAESEIRDILFGLCSMQGCGEGLVIGAGVRTLRFLDGILQSSLNNGCRIISSPLGVLLQGNIISDNNTGGAAEGAKIAGVKAEAGASRFHIWNNFIGGMNAFSGKQQFGVVVANGASNLYSIVNNRIPEKGASAEENTIKAIVDEGGGAQKSVAPNILF